MLLHNVTAGHSIPPKLRKKGRKRKYVVTNCQYEILSLNSLNNGNQVNGFAVCVNLSHIFGLFSTPGRS